MKKSFFLIIPIFIINTISAMDNNQLQTNNFKYDPYKYLFDEKSDGNNTIYQLKTEHYNEFRDILPTIGKYVLTNPECKKHEITLDPPIKEWILKRLVFLHKHNKEIDHRLEHVGQLKKFYFQIYTKGNWICIKKNFTVIENETSPNNFSGSSQKRFASAQEIEDFDSDKLPKQITRAAIYLTDKLKNPHIELLNKIYTEGIAQNKIYSLNELQEKHFTLLPMTFQAVLHKQVYGKKVGDTHFCCCTPTLQNNISKLSLVSTLVAIGAYFIVQTTLNDYEFM